jgi:hypothetical protein
MAVGLLIYDTEIKLFTQNSCVVTSVPIHTLPTFTLFLSNRYVSVDRVSSGGIATRYGLDGSGSNPGGGGDFPHPSRRTRG